MNELPRISAMITRTAKTATNAFISMPPSRSNFTTVRSLRAAIPASENDGRAHATLSPTPLDTHRTPEQCLHETRRSPATSEAVQTPLSPHLSPPPPAPRSPSRVRVALLQKQSAYGEAASTRQKKIFAARAPVRARFPEREGNAAAILKAPSANHVRSASDANSSVLRFLQGGLLRTKRGVP